MHSLRQVERYEEDNRHFAAYFLLNVDRYAGTLELRWARRYWKKLEEDVLRARKDVGIEDLTPATIEVPEPRDVDVPVRRRPIERVRRVDPRQEKLFA